MKTPVRWCARSFVCIVNWCFAKVARALTAKGHEALLAQFQVDREDGLWSWLPENDELVAAAQ